MQVAQNVITDMLKNIKDPKLRGVYGNIISGKITGLVRCNSDNCQGRIIAHITEDGRVDETPPLPQKKLKKGATIAQRVYSSGLEGSRQRFDGQWGFRCYCGNNSILCAEEQGIITPARPSEEDLQKIATRLSRRKGNPYEIKNGKCAVDGFTIEEVKV